MQPKPVRQSSPFFKRKQDRQLNKLEQRNKHRADHKQLSGLIKNIYYFYIFINLYCLLTLYTSSDESLLRASSNITIPVLNSQVPFAFFLFSGVTIIMSLFIYLIIRFEELDKIDTREKMPYIFNSETRSTRQIAFFITYMLGPITVLMFAEKAFIFNTMDRMSAVFVFFVFMAVVSYRRRSKYQITLTSLTFLCAGLFVYLVTVPKPVRFIESRVDLVGSNLSNVQIKDFRIHDPLFNHTRFTGATIIDTTMDGAALWGSNFEGASIYNITIQNSIADYANFNNSIMRDVRMENVSLKQSQFNDAVLFNVTFTQTKNKEKKQIMDTEVKHMDLSNSEFNNTIMVSVSFDKTILSNANFYDTDLESVTFKDAILTRTNFATAKNLTCEALKQARKTEDIIKPSYLRRCKLLPKVAKRG